MATLIRTTTTSSFYFAAPLPSLMIGGGAYVAQMSFGAMDHHPIHLHGYQFKITETDGGPIPPQGQWPEITVLVPFGSTRTIKFVADVEGDWAMHCHMTHHVMNQMGHGLPNMIGVKTGSIDKKVRALLPGYMTMPLLTPCIMTTAATCTRLLQCQICSRTFQAVDDTQARFRCFEHLFTCQRASSLGSDDCVTADKSPIMPLTDVWSAARR